jgi:hypothetical protein
MAGSEREDWGGKGQLLCEQPGDRTRFSATRDRSRGDRIMQHAKIA